MDTINKSPWAQEAPGWLNSIDYWLWDIWATVLKSWPDEPIDMVQRLLGLGEARNPSFLRHCNTTNVKDPRHFLHHTAAKFHAEPPSGEQVRRFLEIIGIERANCATHHDAKVTLKAFRAAGKRMSAISNMWPFPVSHIFGTTFDCDAENGCPLPPLGLQQYFENEFLSCEVGHSKPETEIFSFAAHQVGYEPKRICVVGDSVDSDVRGALAAGMYAVLIDRQHKIPEDVIAALPQDRVWVIDSLVKLLPPLGIELARPSDNAALNLGDAGRTDRRSA
jgi:FMN phosphatase YigB (HAD superfamily)